MKLVVCRKITTQQTNIRSDDHLAEVSDFSCFGNKIKKKMQDVKSK